MPPPKKRVKLVRLELQVHPSIRDWLKRESKRRDVAVAEVVREAILKEMAP